MKDYTTPGGLVFTPTEQCIFYALCRYYEKVKNLQRSGSGSVQAVVACWLSTPDQNLGPMVQYFQAREDLQLQDVIYSLGDFKDFDEWINYVDELELSKDRCIGESVCLSSYKNPYLTAS